MKKLFVLNWLFALLSLGIVSSCSKDASPNEISLLSSKSTSLVPFRTAEEAKAEAIQVLSALGKGEARSVATQNIQSVHYLLPEAIRSEKDNVAGGGVYIVNFQNNGGYIILSEDKRETPILSISLKGNLSPKDTLPPSALMMLANAQGNLHDTQTDYLDEGCPVDVPCDEETNKPVKFTYYNEYGSWEVVESVEPLVPVRWHQYYPFNSKLDLVDGSLPPVGCVATAVMQIMCYHRIPKFYNWNELIRTVNSEYSSETLASLGKDIGRKDLLNMNYTLKGSGADGANVARTLRHYGYQTIGLQKYEVKSVKQAIKEKRPVYVQGFSMKYKHEKRGTLWLIIPDTQVYWTTEHGHAWVLDGIKTLRRKVKRVRAPFYKVMSEYYETIDLVHCNLGWGDTKYNGYYAHQNFRIRKNPDDNPLRTITDSIGTRDYYQFDLYTIHDIQPK